MKRMVAMGAVLVAATMLMGCGEDQQGQKSNTRVTSKTSSSAATPYLVDDPVAAVRKVLPAGWVVQEVKQDAYPTYRPEGKGRAIYVGPKAGHPGAKTNYDAVVFIMPSDYQDGGESDSSKPKLIAMTQDAKIYMTGWPEGTAKVVNALTN